MNIVVIKPGVVGQLRNIIHIKPSDRAVWRELFTKPYLAIDTETSRWTVNPISKKNNEALHPTRALVRLLQLSDGIDSWLVDFGPPGDRKVQEYREFLADFSDYVAENCVIGHNIYFDIVRIYSNFGIIVKRPVCTMLGIKVWLGDNGPSEESVVRSSSVLPGGYGLKNVARILCGFKMSKEEQRSDWARPDLTPEQVEYSAIDPWITFHVFKRLLVLYKERNYLYNPASYERWKLENNFLPVAARMQRTGYPFCADTWERGYRQVREAYKEHLHLWDALGLPFDYSANVAIAKHLGLKSVSKEEFDSSCPVLSLRAKLYGIKALLNSFESFGWAGAWPKMQEFKRQDLTEISLQFLAISGCEISAPANALKKALGIKAIAQMPSELVILRKRYSTISKELALRLEYESPISKWVYTNYSTLTGNGRCSSNSVYKNSGIIGVHAVPARTNPHIKALNLPSPRGVVRVGSDQVFAAIDFAASHFRIAVEKAGDAKAIELLSNPEIDGHSIVAAEVYSLVFGEISLDDFIALYKSGNRNARLCREAAKNTLYGVINGAGPPKIKAQIKANTGVDVALEICERTRDLINQRYESLTKDRQTITRNCTRQAFILLIPASCGEQQERVSAHRLDLPLGGIRTFRSVASYRDHTVNEAPYSDVLAAVWSGVEAVILKKSCIDLHHAYGEEVLSLCGPVHDELDSVFNVEDDFLGQAIATTFEARFSEYLRKVPSGIEAPTLAASWEESK